MKDLHVTAEVLDRFARGDLDDARLWEVLDHLETCQACARAGQDRAANDLAALREEITAEPEPVRRPVMWWALAAAAAAIAVIAALLVQREGPTPSTGTHTVAVPRPNPPAPLPPSPSPDVPTPAKERYAVPEWQKIVDRAVKSGRLPFPKELAELRETGDTYRGGTGPEDRVAPAGIVIDEVRPTFTWPAREGGTYTVSIFADDRELMHSAPLTAARWTPDRNLPRGTTLTWQVEVTGRGPLETIPSPPSPPAMFRILAETDHRALVQARERHGGDDLLLAVLYARGGMREDALVALRRAATVDGAAKRILDHEIPTPR